jgi:1-aminocyclopropane-1-carboxylate deaminase
VINTSTLTPILQDISLPSPEQQIFPDWEHADEMQLWVKRDDLIHPIVSGNKWRKLRYTLERTVSNGVRHIVSFGGGHSNHLHALGYACNSLNIKLTAIVRGHFHSNLTPMLQDLVAWQADVQFVDRKTYQLRDDKTYLASLAEQYPNAMFIPEGGSSEFALAGVADIFSELTQRYDYVLTPVGSGGTLAGLIHGAMNKTEPLHTKIIGIAVLKGEGYLEELVSKLLSSQTTLPSQVITHQPIADWHINHQFHFNGYAKATPELHQFCQTFNQALSIPIEPVYSGKLFWAVKELMAKKAFTPGSKILLLHTGGLQGARE